jgi:DNA-binding transcriptional ArsR family regulator
MGIKPSEEGQDMTVPVAGMHQILAALADPVRLEVVRRLANARAATQCALLYDGISKSTATHHFKVLREAGLIERLTIDGQIRQRLRFDDVETAVPGLLESVVQKANREVVG